ncbi:uncharacterized protein LOC142240649 [Haematobia irritans]|uniref:uncharacterized protein LOC142225445 n=1 Tax=Haematobia irritans TaxID=7368 RepID=UPI003F4F5B60
MAAYLPQPDPSPVRDSRPTLRIQRRANPLRPSRSASRRRHPNWQFSCGLCQEDHALRLCQRFLQYTPFQRYEAVERRGYCRNCLARSHLAPDCPVVTGCRECRIRHHTLLHGAPQLEPVLGVPSPQIPLIQGNAEEMMPEVELPYHRSNVFLPTAVVKVADTDCERWREVRVLLCQSAPISRIAYSVVTRFGFPIIRKGEHRLVRIALQSRHPSQQTIFKVDAVVTRDLPRRVYSEAILEDPSVGFPHPMADRDIRSNDPIDLEIGGDVFAYLRRRDISLTDLGEVYAQKTLLGYIFAGPTNTVTLRE